MCEFLCEVGKTRLCIPIANTPEAALRLSEGVRLGADLRLYQIKSKYAAVQPQFCIISTSPSHPTLPYSSSGGQL